MRAKNWAIVAILAAAGAATSATATRAQGSLRTSQAIHLIAIKPPSIGISLSSPGPVTFNLNGTISVGNPAPAMTIHWNLSPRNQVIRVCASLSGPLTATTGEPSSIPISHVKARTEPAGMLRNFAGSACGETAALEISNVVVNKANNKQGSKKESLVLEINEDGLNLPAATYIGTLNIIADVVERP